MRMREDLRSLSGQERAAILILSLGEEHTAKLFSMMDDEEIKEISQTMANLGTVSANHRRAAVRRFRRADLRDRLAGRHLREHRAAA